MRYAILSDVHGRHWKLAGVLADIQSRGVQRIASLGDVGGDPCLALLREAGAMAVFGNYEVSGWRRLLPEHRAWVRDWPPLLSDDGFLAVHAAPWWPEGLHSLEDFGGWLDSPGRSWRALFPYLTDSQDSLRRALGELEIAGKSILFHGHTHVQSIWHESPDGHLRQVKAARASVRAGHRYLVGVGSVGLPEDGGWATYTLYDATAGHVEQVRLARSPLRQPRMQISEGGIPMPSDEESLLLVPETLRFQLADGQVKEMPLDEYLKGVVPAEMGMAKPLEALKAQAIAARSFAVVTRRHARDGFDVCTTTHCQVWKPERRYTDADRAVDETTGMILTYGGRSVAAHFFAHCDGQTRNSEEVWSGVVAYCRSVPCICGYTTLHGHGVGMCQSGAVAMAQGGATAREILQHYYTGTEVAEATSILRDQFQRSVIVGELVDDQGNPRAGVELTLRGPTGRIARRTNDQGQFWISSLPAGDWELEVKDKPVRYKGIRTDGRNTLDLRVGMPDTAPEALRTTPLGHPRQLIGTLGCDDVQIVMTDATGKETVLLGGSAPDFGPGGFAIPLPESGAYTLHVLGQRFDLDVSDTGVWLRFIAKPG